MADRPAHGFLLVLGTPSPTDEEEFNAWYDAEHLAERMAVKGFLSGQRYVAIEGYPKYLAHYDTETPEVLDSPEYMKVSGANFSPWTVRVTTSTKVDRSAGRQIWPGEAVLPRAPRLRLVRFDLAGQREETLIARVQEISGDPAAGTRAAMVLEQPDPLRHYVLFAASFLEPEYLFLPRFGDLAGAVVQHNTYADYMLR
ncbi:hypothetical protein EF888_14930 [Silicimonas algicola]|uniref:Uncharacterized protein n=1 Tax=Silicimonas algicola TaxID=1826607 RepID=A0A316FWJ7_9RHOB|nr:DUF4286 family protein [Silicimonas algicola]AZQ68314.1 hypothetical protein EF888_14930 [Silicimonas algicola]PWK52712.1 hypothetical protein C8D95_1169 [Silicimonas algicola]